MVRVRVRAVVADACSATTWRIVDVTCNQPAQHGGFWRNEVDWRIVDDHHVQLRAERSGGRDRIYQIVLRATDARGNESAPETVTVTVSRSSGRR